MGVRVSAQIPDEGPSGEVVAVPGPGGRTDLLVCAVPFLRDRDLRLAEEGESQEDRDRKLALGIEAHYREAARAARSLQERCGRRVPVVGMGHLFMAGGRTSEGDGTRGLYVGSLGSLSAEAMPESFSYLALGHLHSAQRCGGRDHIRYSGSPLAMSFGEAGREKSVTFLELCPEESEPGRALVNLEEIAVPVFQEIRRVKGDMASINKELEELRARDSTAWLEIAYDGEERREDLRAVLEEAVRGSRLEILAIRSERLWQAALESGTEESLAELSPVQVFERCLDDHGVPEGRREALMASYREILASIAEEDRKAE
jgi:exonuclease SbcD